MFSSPPEMSAAAIPHVSFTHKNALRNGTEYKKGYKKNGQVLFYLYICTQINHCVTYSKAAIPTHRRMLNLKTTINK